MSIRSELATSARAIIGEFGYALTLSRTTGSSYSSATGTNTLTTANFSVVGVVTDYTDNEIDGVTILSEDRKVIIQGGVAIPQVNDTITGFYGTMRVVSVNTTTVTTSVDMFYVCQARS